MCAQFSCSQRRPHTSRYFSSESGALGECAEVMPRILSDRVSQRNAVLLPLGRRRRRWGRNIARNDVDRLTQAFLAERATVVFLLRAGPERILWAPATTPGKAFGAPILSARKCTCANAQSQSRLETSVLRLAGSRRLMVVRAFSHAHTIQTQGLAGAGAGWLCGIVMTIGCGEDCAAGAASLATWAAPWKDATVIC